MVVHRVIQEHGEMDETTISSANEIFHKIVEYKAPSWCSRLKVIPKYRIPFAMKPTPIHQWNVKDVPGGFHLSIKRDDLTGCALSGNKVRKLEFILAEAKAEGYTDVVTIGATQSNHARATLIAANQIGLKCHLVLMDKNEDCRMAPPSGNFLLMLAEEPDIYLIPWTTAEDWENTFEIAQRAVVERINKDPGRSAYCIPSGGECPIGLHGYIYAWEEMMQQKIEERFDDVICAAGTIGTSFGLAVGNYLTGNKVRVHAINIEGCEEHIRKTIDNRLTMFGIDEVRSRDIIDIIDDHVGEGFNEFTEEDINYYQHIASTTGIFCDPVFVGKAFKGLMKEFKTNPGRFKGKRILFVHTGGIFGMMESSVGSFLRSKTALDRIKNWEDVFPDKKLTEKTPTDAQIQ